MEAFKSATSESPELASKLGRFNKAALIELLIEMQRLTLMDLVGLARRCDAAIRLESSSMAMKKACDDMEKARGIDGLRGREAFLQAEIDFDEACEQHEEASNVFFKRTSKEPG